jgi:hypothetical protein
MACRSADRSIMSDKVTLKYPQSMRDFRGRQL